MSLNRGPIEGGQDERPFLRCSFCTHFAKCYRGKLIATVETAIGTFERFQWYCDACMAVTVGEAIRLADAT